MKHAVSPMAIALFFGSLGLGLGLVVTANATDSAHNASGASGHAIKAVTLGIAASGQVTLGVSAVPVMSAGGVSQAVGAVGAASTAAGRGSAAAAGSTQSGPLPVTDETISITSPAEALKQHNVASPR